MTASAVAASAGALGASLWFSRRRAAAGKRGPIGARLQTWVPAAPRTTLGRAAAVLWAAPVTAAGLLAGAASVAPPRLRDGVVLFTPARGLTGWAIRRRGFAAAGLGHIVLSLQEPSEALMAHELVHVRQAERLGPLIAPTYLTLLAVHGYQRHPMEQAARLAVLMDTTDTPAA